MKSSVAALSLALAASSIWVGCGSGALKPAPGMGCALNSDCAAGLTCTFGACHTPCKLNGDCPTPELCIKSNPSVDAGVDAGTVAAGTVNVCQLPKELNCVYNSNCMAPLVCARDEQCRNQCQTEIDCVSPQVCTTSKVCALTSQLVPGTNDVPLVTAGQGGAAGSQATGTGGAGGATATGGGGSSGGSSSKDGSVDAMTPPPSCVAGLAGFHPSNLPVSLTLPKSLIATTLSGMATFDTDALTLSGGMDAGQWNTMTVTMSGGYEAAVAIFDTFTLASGATLQITGARPLILVANGNLEIDGTIVGVRSPTNGWYGGGPPAPSTPMRGGQCALNVLAGGGGPGDVGAEMGAAGGGYCGRGGNGSTVADGGGSPSPGGIAYGTASLVPLAGGASGGSTNGADITNHGGGAIELVSGSLLTIGDNGTINLGGGGTDPGYAVGGGSGGGILLEAPTVIVRGILTVNGGSGSATGNGASQPGQPSLQPAVGGGKVAGNGSAGANINGGDALLQSNPAGGGGGAGRIRINTGCGGSFKPSSGAIISPTSATTCVSTGPLD